MPTRSARKSSAQSDLFGAPAQAELFPPPPPDRYVPKPEYVRSAFISHLQKLAEAPDWWIWHDFEIKRFRDEWPQHLADFLPDRQEAAEWMAKINAEIARLDACSPTERTPGRFTARALFDPPWRIPGT